MELMTMTPAIAPAASSTAFATEGHSCCTLSLCQNRDRGGIFRPVCLQRLRFLRTDYHCAQDCVQTSLARDGFLRYGSDVG